MFSNLHAPPQLSLSVCCMQLRQWFKALTTHNYHMSVCIKSLLIAPQHQGSLAPLCKSLCAGNEDAVQMAINLQMQLALQGNGYAYGGSEDPLAVLYSNRSAAHASLKRWQEASEDAEDCIALRPSWSKVVSK